MELLVTEGYPALGLQDHSISLHDLDPRPVAGVFCTARVAAAWFTGIGENPFSRVSGLVVEFAFAPAMVCVAGSYWRVRRPDQRVIGAYSVSKLGEVEIVANGSGSIPIHLKPIGQLFRIAVELKSMTD